MLSLVSEHSASFIIQLQTKLFEINLFYYIRSNKTAKFADNLKLRGGVYFVDSLSKTDTGKFRQKDITKLASELFARAKTTDPDIQSYLLDIPEEFRSIIIKAK